MAKFKKGESGNPGGRPKELHEVREVALKLFDAEYWKATKARLLAGKVKPAVEVRLLSYAYGEPLKKVSVNGEVTVKDKRGVLRDLPDDVVRDLLARDAFERADDDTVN